MRNRLKKRNVLHSGKRWLAILLSICMIAGMVPVTARADSDDSGTTSKSPSVSVFATKEQMMDDTFAPNSNGEAANYGKLVFGKKSDGTTAQEWYILGKDDGVSGDNTIIFAASPIVTNQKFEDDWQNNKTDTSLWSDCDYNGVSITEVYPNHYGASDLRVALKGMTDGSNTIYFTTAEQDLMNATEVTTMDLKNNVNYTTSDKLYALAAESYSDTTIKAGSDNSTVLAVSSYWGSGKNFWLRSPIDGSSDGALPADPGYGVGSGSVDGDNTVRPASNLNLSSVLFASAASSPASDTAESGTIASDKAMTLRLDGTSKNIGTARYNTKTGDINVTKGSTQQSVALVVQGNDGTNNFYYSKQITGTETVVNVSEITNTYKSASRDLSDYKIWLEITDTDGMIYAVNADEEVEPINTTYVTKEQLMGDTFKPNADGSATNIGKLVFGKNSNGKQQEWYILGKDDGVSGDNTIIFATSPIATNQMFEDDYDNNKNFQESFGVYETNPTEVYVNHYGASNLRVALQNMVDGSNTSYFTAAEQGLMNDTTVTTNDTKNSTTYTTTDKLYALQGNKNNNQYLWAGTDDSTVLAMSSYWFSGDEWFWLRSPSGEFYPGDALNAYPETYVGDNSVSDAGAVQPASNLNLSSVLFASAAKAASSDTAESGTIASDTAMTLRLDGENKMFGKVTYTADRIKAVKLSDTGNVALVVQGNDGTNNWYYSKQITGTETVKVSDIKTELSKQNISDVDLSKCKIWLESTDTDGMVYAVNATEVEEIPSVEIHLPGDKAPVANNILSIYASCNTTGVSGAYASWSPDDGTAKYNTVYTATISLSAEQGYEFADDVTATISGNTADIQSNTGGMLIVTYTYPATEKRKIASVTAPTTPADSTFANYYGYGGYAESPISGTISELGTKATITFTDSETDTEDIDVTWTIDGNEEYNKEPGAENTFRWTIPADKLADYDVADCAGYDATTGTITGTVKIKNKAATSVTITGTDSDTDYTGADIDVSQYFTIDEHAGQVTYSLITGAEGGTGNGTLSGKNLTVTKTGTFKIKASVAANGIYAAGEKIITLTVKDGTIGHTVSGYSGTYDGQEHSISVNVSESTGTVITYSIDGTNYTANNPSYTDAGTYTVYYQITKDNYTTIKGSETVTINNKEVTITAGNQTISRGTVINQSNYTKDGLLQGDSIAEIKLIPSTDAVTTDGTITVDGVKIINAANNDVTKNYDIKTVSGNLIINRDTTAPTVEIQVGTNKWNKFLNTVTFGHFFKETKKVTITASDNITKKPEIKYYLSDKVLTENELNSDTIKWIDYTGAFSITANNKKIIYAKATDEDGNVTIVNSDGVVVYTDSAADTTELTYIKNVTGDMTAKVKLNGNTVAGIKNADKALVSGTDYTVDADGNITFKESYLKTLDVSATAYTLTVSYNPMGEAYVEADGNEAPATTQISLKVRNPKLTSVTQPAEIKGVANGTAKTVKDIGLPETVVITTENTSITTAKVTWDLENLAGGTYSPDVLTEQKFTVKGTVSLPVGVDKADSISLEVAVDVTVSAAEVVKAPTASLAGGTYSENKSVTLSSATDGAKIYYTTDGTIPALKKDGTPDGTTLEYKSTSPIEVTGTQGQSVVTTIKTIAVKQGMFDSKIAEFEYTINVPHTHGFDQSVWTNNTTHHWHECNVENCDKGDLSIADKALHEFEYSYVWSSDNKKCTATKICKVCGYTDSETVNAVITITQNKSCTLPELTTYTATFNNVFDEKFAEQTKANVQTADATGHTVVEDAAVAATCTTAGKTVGSHCTVCNEVLVSQEEIPAIGHDFGDWETVKSQNCTDKGSQKRECKVCGYIETKDVDATGHTWEANFTIDKEATCTEDGSKSIHCKKCDATKDSTVIKAYGHTVVEDAAVDATCTTAGKTSGSHCSICKEVLVAQEEIPAIGHDFGDWETVKSPNCTDKGSQKKECKVCGYIETKDVEEIGHTWDGDFTVDKEASCREDGSKSIHCKKCDATKDSTVIPATGHVTSDWIVDEEATTESAGSKHKECTICGKILENAEIEKLLPPTYEIIAGADSKWFENTDGSLVIKGDGAFSKFICVKVDGDVINEENYIVEEGSTIVKLKAEYLKSLAVGKHSFEIIWSDGTAATNFTVVENVSADDKKPDNGKDNIPPAVTVPDNKADNKKDAKTDEKATVTKTGDDYNAGLWLLIMLVSLAGIASMEARIKRNNKMK